MNDLKENSRVMHHEILERTIIGPIRLEIKRNYGVIHIYKKVGYAICYFKSYFLFGPI